jgi:hypothetical protein
LENPPDRRPSMAVVHDVGKLKAAQNAILDKIAELTQGGAMTGAGKFGPADDVKALAEAFRELAAGAAAK